LIDSVSLGLAKYNTSCDGGMTTERNLRLRTVVTNGPLSATGRSNEGCFRETDIGGDTLHNFGGRKNIPNPNTSGIPPFRVASKCREIMK
jgi:archaeosine-15-forming tRNA-guanine transglycosylase